MIFSGWPICSEFAHENPNPQAHIFFALLVEDVVSLRAIHVACPGTIWKWPKDTEGSFMIVCTPSLQVNWIFLSESWTKFGEQTWKIGSHWRHLPKPKNRCLLSQKNRETKDYPVEETFATMLHKQRVWHEASSRPQQESRALPRPPQQSSNAPKDSTGSTHHLHNFECHFSLRWTSVTCASIRTMENPSAAGILRFNKFNKTLFGIFRTGKSNSFGGFSCNNCNIQLFV